MKILQYEMKNLHLNEDSSIENEDSSAENDDFAGSGRFAF